MLTFCARHKETQKRENTVYRTLLSKSHEFNSCSDHLNRYLLNCSLLFIASPCLVHCLLLKLWVLGRSSWQKEWGLWEALKDQKQRPEVAHCRKGQAYPHPPTSTPTGTCNQSKGSDLGQQPCWSMSSLPILFTKEAWCPWLCLSSPTPLSNSRFPGYWFWPGCPAGPVLTDAPKCH